MFFKPEEVIQFFISRGLNHKVLNPQALTIGFARRFATYIRGDFILKNPERLAKILNDPERPVQIIFAG
jgi:starch phosphorylase